MPEVVLPETLQAPDGTTLRRAIADDRKAVEDLQFAAYALNRRLLGVEPLPLQSDFDTIFRDHEIWVHADQGRDDIAAVLILTTDRLDDIWIWSVATAPDSQKRGLGRALLECAEVRARQLGRRQIRLYTGQVLTHLVAWYSRHGFMVERLEEMSDRKAVHMLKPLA